MPAADLGPVRPGGDGEGSKTEIHPDKPADPGSRTRLMAALRVEVGGADVEGHIPAGTAPHDGGEQDRSAGGELLLSRDGIDV